MLHRAIGIFDSGVGGLTVAAALKRLLPFEQQIYFGDTLHLPYGDKSAETVSHYSKKISAFLLEKNCKVILIACNTASSVAYEAVRASVGDKALVFNVIDPVVKYVSENRKCRRIGVIGTKGTINSGTYYQKIKHANSSKDIISLATPLLVPMIEEGFIYDDISNAIIRSYLSQDILKGIDTLILGCTHYPIIKNQISKFFDFTVNIIDSAQIVAQHVRDVLKETGLLYMDGKQEQSQFYVSDYTEYFDKIARMFFEEELLLSKADIWKTN